MHICHNVMSDSLCLSDGPSTLRSYTLRCVLLFVVIVHSHVVYRWTMATRVFLCLLAALSVVLAEEYGSNLDPHPDPNEEDYEGMIYVGKVDEAGRRLARDQDWEIHYWFGSSLTNETQEGWDRHKPVNPEGPKRYLHVDPHPLDGGVTPLQYVAVEPFFLDATPVTNAQFADFVRRTLYETEAEKYGWSFVLESFVPGQEDAETDPEAEHWKAVQGAYWKQPEGPGSSYKHRQEHPVVHVSHRDAAEYCTWKGKRLPGEREYEGATRLTALVDAEDVDDRDSYAWKDQEWFKHANLWGHAPFPHENDALDGWRGTSPVKHFPSNALGFYDTTGNVWEWMRGGKHKERIVRGASYVDTVDGSHNHAATLGARATLHGTTATGNVGFRCAKSPKKRVEHHYAWHDESEHGPLAIEDEFGKRDYVPKKGWEDFAYDDSDEDDEFAADNESKLKKKKVVTRHERFATEL